MVGEVVILVDEKVNSMSRLITCLVQVVQLPDGSILFQNGFPERLEGRNRSYLSKNMMNSMRKCFWDSSIID